MKATYLAIVLTVGLAILAGAEIVYAQPEQTSGAVAGDSPGESLQAPPGSRNREPTRPPAEDSIRPGNPSGWDKIFGTRINPDPLVPEIPLVNDAARATGIEGRYIRGLQGQGYDMPGQSPLARYLSLARWYNRGARVVNSTWQWGPQAGMEAALIEAARLSLSNGVRMAYIAWAVPMLAFVGSVTAPYIAVPVYVATIYMTYEADRRIGNLAQDQLDRLTTVPGIARPLRPGAPGLGRPIGAPAGPARTSPAGSSGGSSAGGCPPAK